MDEREKKVKHFYFRCDVCGFAATTQRYDKVQRLLLYAPGVYVRLSHYFILNQNLNPEKKNFRQSLQKLRLKIESRANYFELPISYAKMVR